MWGSADLLDILADPEHLARAERLEWIGEGEFDPEAFDREAADAALAAAFAKGRRGVWTSI